MLPDFRVATLHLSTYWVVYGLAIGVAGMFSFHRLVQGGILPRHAGRIVLLTIWLGLAGAVVGRSLIPLLQTFALSGALIWQGGSASAAALITSTGVVVLICQHQGLPLGRVSDLWGLPIPLGQAIGRLGCLAAGCCYGKATGSWLGMFMPGRAGVWMVRYPTQLLAAAANLLIFVTLLAVERYGKRRLSETERSTRGWPFDGFLFLLYVALYCLQRFSLEFLRGDAEPVLGQFTIIHIVCATGLIGSVALIARNLRSAGPSPAAPAS